MLVPKPPGFSLMTHMLNDTPMLRMVSQFSLIKPLLLACLSACLPVSLPACFHACLCACVLACLLIVNYPSPAIACSLNFVFKRVLLHDLYGLLLGLISATKS